jgi:hypothetical protein
MCDRSGLLQALASISEFDVFSRLLQSACPVPFGHVVNRPPSRHLASSTRSTAEVFAASSSYVQRVRNAVAVFISNVQEKFLATCATTASHVVVRVSADETEMPTWFEKEHGCHSIMIMSGTIFRREVSGDTSEHHLAIPPAALKDKSARCMLAALANRFGVCLWAEGTRSLLIFSSDSAKSMLKVARAYKAECVRRNGLATDKSSEGRSQGIKLSMHSRLSESVALCLVDRCLCQSFL